MYCALHWPRPTIFFFVGDRRMPGLLIYVYEWRPMKPDYAGHLLLNKCIQGTSLLLNLKARPIDAEKGLWQLPGRNENVTRFDPVLSCLMAIPLIVLVCVWHPEANNCPFFELAKKNGRRSENDDLFFRAKSRVSFPQGI